MVTKPMLAEGWYRDPYRRHEARWFSVGRPTALVRDDRVESRDEPPTLFLSRDLAEVGWDSPD